VGAQSSLACGRISLITLSQLLLEAAVFPFVLLEADGLFCFQRGIVFW